LTGSTFGGAYLGNLVMTRLWINTNQGEVGLGMIVGGYPPM